MEAEVITTDVQEDVVDKSLEASDTDNELEFGVVATQTATETEETDGKAGEKEETSRDQEVSSEKVQEKEVDPKEAEIRMLRQISREQKQRIDSLENAVLSTQEKLKQANLITPEDEEAAAIQSEAYNLKVEKLNDLLEVMAVNPKYEDVTQVVSQTHFDDMVDIMAKALEEQGHGKADLISKQLTQEIWNLPNPYKYMYELIKEHHPEYKKSDVLASAEKSMSQAAGAKKEPPKTAGSIVDAPGGVSSSVVGWTAKMIDSLPEEKLNTVPADVYEKYMRNELK